MDKREELVELLNRLVAVPATENEDREIANRIEELIPDPEWSDYIFYSSKFKKLDGTVDIEKVVDKILSYEPIILPYRP